MKRRTLSDRDRRRFQRLIPLAGWARLVLLLVALPGCSSERPNVVLYVVDTLRADAISPYGNPVVDTPTLAHLAQEGTLFENAYAHSSWTRPSIVSILTGLSPDEHGVETRTHGLSQSSQLLSEQFRDRGYSTAAIVTNPNVASFFGFDQGYDDFIELFERSEAGYVDAKELIANSALVTERASQWLDAAGRPFFLFILVIDPHWPYLPPAGFDRYVGDYRGGITGDDFALLRSDVSEEDMERMRSLYYGEVAFVDRSFGALLDHLRERGLYDDTVIVFTSDHGEEFWEHGIRGHGRNLFEGAIRVPLIVRDPRSGNPGSRISRTARSIDIYPTLLEMAGLPVPDSVAGRSLFDDPSARELYSSLDLDGTRMKALTIFPWKLIVDETREKRMLVNLISDPREERDLLERHPEEADRLAARLADRMRAGRGEDSNVAEEMFGAHQPETQLPGAVRDALEALGYLDDREETSPHRAPGAQQTGLVARYYPNLDWQGDPVHRWIDSQISFDWLEPPRPLRSPFSIEWTGALRIERAGLYTFSLESDDGSTLEIDERLVVDNGGVHAVRSRSGSVHLSEGTHAVRIRYFNKMLGGMIRMTWKPPDGPPGPVPAEVWMPIPISASDPAELSDG